MGIAEVLKKRKEELAAKNTAEGNAFRKQFAEDPTVKKEENGLLIKVEKMGEGATPSATSKVLCHYHGTTIHGEVFDSSVNRNKPASFPLDKVIKGWTQALTQMPVGSKWTLVLPPELAYGNQQLNQYIGPQTTLVFQVELIAILDE